MLNWQSVEATRKILSEHSVIWLKLLSIGILISSAGCSGGKPFQNPLTPDPQLKQPVTIGTKPAAQTDSTANPLPADFPMYPQAKLHSTEPTSGEGKISTWTTADPIDRVYAFYQQELPAKQWQILSTPNDTNPQLTAKTDTTSVTIEKVASTGETQYTIALQSATRAEPIPTPTNNPTPSTSASSTPSSAPTAAAKTDRQQPIAAADYINDLVQIGVLSKPDPSNTKAPLANRVVTRREYARWLMAANDRINSSKPSHQIKLATATTKPVFADVPANHPDFASIQGLAEAGIVPSSLSGDATTVLFRPDAPLTREQMILWKVPLDTRQALPAASLTAIQQTWGFQDAGKISPQAQRAVLADFHNGDRSNIRRAFGYTTLFQPQKPIALGEVAATIWYFGANSEGLSARDVR